MNKIKLFSFYYEYKLEEEVNNFIKDKNIINISYSVVTCGYEYKYCCCILYREP